MSLTHVNMNSCLKCKHETLSPHQSQVSNKQVAIKAFGHLVFCFTFPRNLEKETYFWSKLFTFENSKPVRVFRFECTFIHVNVDRCPTPP